jgi:hypothetical protein
VSPPRSRRSMGLRGMVLILILAVVALVNVPTLAKAVRSVYDDYRAETQGYKERMGHWDELHVPARFRVNSVHAAMLYTGKVLLIAGSGNNAKAFKAGTFKTLLWDPATGTFKLIPTPSDMFCGGHTFLPDGRVLIAGGTTAYEKLAPTIVRAAGKVTVVNTGPHGEKVVVPKGTLFHSRGGVAFRTLHGYTVPATMRKHHQLVMGTRNIWVEAVKPGKGSVIDRPTTLAVTPPGPPLDVEAQTERLTMEKQDAHGSRKSYLFDPATERYEQVGSLHFARWYPSLVSLTDGRVLALSGLDDFGNVIKGNTEVWDPKTENWHNAPELWRQLPTYPSVFQLGKDRLFYTGSNTGYGPDNVGHTPGIWHVGDNDFDPVFGLRDADQTQTSGSVWLPPAQDKRFMVAGGGGVGESPRSTARTDIVDLKAAKPRFEPGPDLLDRTRYPEIVITPDDKVVITGGSRDYRGKGDSNLFVCQLYDPRTNAITRLADPHIGRNYHAEALLLPDGRIVTMGGDSLYNKTDNGPGKFQQRIEIYSPPYLFHGARPELTGGPTELRRGEAAMFETVSPSSIATAKLMRPSAVTHVTDLEQRSIALTVAPKRGAVELGVPHDEGILPDGWYMLFVTDGAGTPSIARWVHVG